MWLILILIVCSVNAELHEGLSKIVKMNQGFVRGYREKVGQHFAFYGIPYATTPLRMNRFKAPLPPPSWSNIFNATRNNIVCPQRRRPNENVTYQEDCLNINVFVPYNDVDNKKILPVIVYVHGGSFIHSGDRGGCDRLTKHGVIVVTFQYRVGILGFLCLGTADAPGNAGIKDQIAALKWVHENIIHFGGDPDNVTVYGTSAGAVSVDVLRITDKARGLFKRAILESGSAVMGQFEKNSTQQALDLAIKMGFRNTNRLQDLLMFFKTLPANVLALAPMDDFSIDSKVGPCIERFQTNETIITKHPMDIIKQNIYTKIPYMAGFANLEGITHAKHFLTIRSNIYSNFSKIFSLHSKRLDAKSIRRYQEKIRKAYFGNQEIKIDNSFIKFCTDVFVAYPSLVSVVNDAKRSKSPVYLFEFTYDGGLGLPRENFKHLVGARHSDFWAYLFTHGVSSNKTEDRMTADRLSTLVTNFVKFGDPIPSSTNLLPAKWTPVGKKSVNYLSIGNNVEMRPNIFDKRLELLDKFSGCHLCSSSSDLISLFKLCLFGVTVVIFF